jgi:membrane protease YdiL (CAAX protease family)
MTWIDKARAKYPLPVEEEGLLVNVVLASVLLTLLAAMACSMMLSVLQGANLWDALTFSWAAGIADALKVGWPWSLALGAGLGAVLLAVNALGERAILHGPRDEWRESLLEMREGLNGELPRVAAWKTPLLMLAVAAVEETGFRYAVIGVVMVVAEPAVGFLPAAVVAVGASAAVFAVMHFQYRGYATMLVGVLGLLFGIVYVATGALLAVIVAHWIYDVGVVFNEARKMTRDPHYFPRKNSNGRRLGNRNGPQPLSGVRASSSAASLLHQHADGHLVGSLVALQGAQKLDAEGKGGAGAGSGDEVLIHEDVGGSLVHVGRPALLAARVAGGLAPAQQAGAGQQHRAGANGGHVLSGLHAARQLGHDPGALSQVIHTHRAAGHHSHGEARQVKGGKRRIGHKRHPVGRANRQIVLDAREHHLHPAATEHIRGRHHFQRLAAIGQKHHYALAHRDLPSRNFRHMVPIVRQGELRPRRSC